MNANSTHRQSVATAAAIGLAALPGCAVAKQLAKLFAEQGWMR